MVTGRLVFDITLTLLFISTFTAFILSFINWKSHRTRKMFWYLVILASQLLLSGGILLSNYLDLANKAFADNQLSIILDDSYWILVSSFFKVVIIGGMIYGITQSSLTLMPIAVRGKKRLIALSILLIAVIIIIFLIIIKKEASNSLFNNARAVVNGMLYPIGCIIAGVQAASVLIPSIALQLKGKRRENYTGLIIFMPFIILPIMDFTWFAGEKMQSYIRLSYFAVIPMLVTIYKELKLDVNARSEALTESKDKLEYICSRFEISEREKDVLKLIMEGKNHQSVADKLCISINTVKSHLQSIYKKMKVSSKIQLLLKINSINQ